MVNGATMIQNHSLLKRELFSWLYNVLIAHSYDYVVCVERKATAVIRMYLDFDNQCDFESDKALEWNRVLSSDALAYLPDNHLAGKRVLIFNEMIHHGRSTLETLKRIKENSESVAKVEAAAFACSIDFPSENWENDWGNQGGTPNAPHHVRHPKVSEREYEIRWRQVVEMLRTSGALLLDTEHIETSFKLRMPIRAFVEALCDVGLPVEYESGDISWPIGVTVRDPFVADLERLQLYLPDGIDIEERPKKIRLVRREHDEFAFIAIWYPPLPIDKVEDYINSNSVPDYIRPVMDHCKAERRPELLFHLIGLVCSMELLRSVWAALGPLVRKKLVIPIFSKGSIKPGEQLGHLRALYPFLNFNRLESEILAALSMSKDISAIKKAQIKRRSMSSWKKDLCSEFIDARTIIEGARRILIELVKKKLPVAIEEEWLDEEEDVAPEVEFTWNEFWQEGMDLSIRKTIRSIVMDYAIDNAILKTKHLVTKREGREYLVRSYAVDNEFALEGLIRLAYGGESLRSGQL
jgi:hypothetical protein